jgi:5-methylcytosine-specific restriction endonuclease McrA
MNDNKGMVNSLSVHDSNAVRNKDTRLLVLKALGGKCIVCGSVEDLRAHHKNYESDKDKLSDIVLLCRDCHKKHTKFVVYNV